MNILIKYIDLILSFLHSFKYIRLVKDILFIFTWLNNSISWNHKYIFFCINKRTDNDSYSKL